jgi:hypothetical protein
MSIYTSLPNIFTCLAKGNPQRENFLSETFVFVMRKLLNSHNDQSQQFVRELLKAICAVDFYEDEHISLTREEKVTGGRIDIKIETPTKLIYIENKIESSVNLDQIEKYKSVLGKQKTKNTKIILITKYSIEDRLRKVVDNWLMWDDIHKLIRNLRETGEKHLPETDSFLVEHLFNYLKEDDMTIEKVSSAFVEGITSMINLLAQIRFVLDEGGYKIEARSAGEQFNGFYIKVDRDSSFREWIGIFYYDNYGKPSVDGIVFELSGLENPETVCKRRFQIESDAKRFNTASLLFNFEDTEFFMLEKHEQLSKLREFVQEGVELIKEYRVDKKKS